MSTLNDPTLPLDKWQTTFFFNIHANFKTDPSEPEVIVSVPLDKTLPLDEALKTATATATVDLTETLRLAIDKAIEGNNTSESPFLEGNDWKTVWGPQVFCIGPQQPPEPDGGGDTPEFTSTNAMYVVHSVSCNRYIVAIAATNTPSNFDWIVEDFDTSHVVAWDGALHVWKERISPSAITPAALAAAADTADTAVTAAANIPCISRATFTGSTILLNLVDTVVTQKTLVDFLKGLTPLVGATITFTGHSLAGALSPTLAMACFDPGAGLLKDSAWSIGGVMVYPTAGATPGNGLFASRFNGAGWGGADDKGKHLWQVWNHNLYNNLDIVPHAWGAAMMGLIPGLYSVHYKDPTDVANITGVVVAVRVKASIGEKVAGAYTPISKQALTPVGVIGEFFDAPLLEQAALQHTVAYGNLLGIPKALQSNNSKV